MDLIDSGRAQATRETCGNGARAAMGRAVPPHTIGPGAALLPDRRAPSGGSGALAAMGRNAMARTVRPNAIGPGAALLPGNRISLMCAS